MGKLKELQAYQSPTARIRGLFAAMHVPGCLAIGLGVIIAEATTSQVVSAIAAASFGLLSAAYLGLETLSIALLSLLFLFAYHVGAKRLGLLGDALAGAIVGLFFIYAGFAVGSPSWSLVIFAIMAFLATMAREIMKEVAVASVNPSKDDSPRENPSQIGRKSATFFLATVAVSALPVAFGLVTSYYLPLAVICDIGLLLTAFSMIAGPTQRTAKRNENYVLLWMSFGLLAFLIGAI
jgi:4-hydroxybenzoate polyprenyltransferase